MSGEREGTEREIFEGVRVGEKKGECEWREKYKCESEEGGRRECE